MERSPLYIQLVSSLRYDHAVSPVHLWAVSQGFANGGHQIRDDFSNEGSETNPFRSIAEAMSYILVRH